MPDTSRTSRSPLRMVVLSLLLEGPKHPYLMQKQIRERRKDTVVNVANRNSVQQVVKALVREGLVVPADAGESDRGTTYRITEAGRDYVEETLREALRRPAREFPVMPAALAHIAALPAEDVRTLLAERRAVLLESLRDEEQLSTHAYAQLPRVLVLEDEYQQAMTRAEVSWIDAVIDDLDSGVLEWDRDELIALGRVHHA